MRRPNACAIVSRGSESQSGTCKHCLQAEKSWVRGHGAGGHVAGQSWHLPPRLRVFLSQGSEHGGGVRCRAPLTLVKEALLRIFQRQKNRKEINSILDLAGSQSVATSSSANTLAPPRGGLRLRRVAKSWAEMLLEYAHKEIKLQMLGTSQMFMMFLTTEAEVPERSTWFLSAFTDPDSLSWTLTWHAW